MQDGDDLPGLLGDLVRLGVVASVDLAQGRAVIRCGDILSPPCRWLERAGDNCSWTPPSVGEQGLLICPEGEIAAAVFLPGIFSDTFPAPGNAHRRILHFADGAEITYDPQAHALQASLPESGTARIDAKGGIALIGDVTITGKLTASDDVLAGAISLKGHKHGGVEAGSAKTQVPE